MRKKKNKNVLGGGPPSQDGLSTEEVFLEDVGEETEHEDDDDISDTDSVDSSPDLSVDDIKSKLIQELISNKKLLNLKPNIDYVRSYYGRNINSDNYDELFYINDDFIHAAFENTNYTDTLEDFLKQKFADITKLEEVYTNLNYLYNKLKKKQKKK